MNFSVRCSSRCLRSTRLLPTASVPSCFRVLCYQEFSIHRVKTFHSNSLGQQKQHAPRIHRTQFLREDGIDFTRRRHEAPPSTRHDTTSKRRRIAVVTLLAFILGGFTYHKLTEGRTHTLAFNQFTRFELINKQSVSRDSTIFTVRVKRGSLDRRQLATLSAQGIWSVQIKQPQLQIVREYTPLPNVTYFASNALAINSPDGDRGELQFLVRREVGGEVSQYLHSLPIGHDIEIRRPKLETPITPRHNHYVFLAGGTGIAPALQLAALLSHRPGAKLHILWANRREDDCQGAKISNVNWTTRLGELFLWRHSNAWSSFWTAHDSPAGFDTFQSIDHTVEWSPIVKVLEAVKAASRLGPFNREQGDRCVIDVDYFVDERGSFITPRFVENAMHVMESDPDKSSKEDASAPDHGAGLVLVSGPDGFVKHWTAPAPFTPRWLQSFASRWRAEGLSNGAR